MDFASMDRQQLTLAGAGFSVMLTLHYSFQLLSQHLFYWKNPKEQRAILIIVLMAPVYAVNSFFGLVDAGGSKPLFMLLNSVKECYEALAIAKFLELMYSYVNISMSRNIVPDEIKGREIHHSFPMSLFLIYGWISAVIEREGEHKKIRAPEGNTYELNCRFLSSYSSGNMQPRKTYLNHQSLGHLKNWTWQFVIIRPVCSVLMTTLRVIGMYPSWLSWAFTIVLNLSVCLAIYSLVVFYHVFAKELEPHKPLSKFLCIKGIVFFCFWQGMLLDILVSMGIIQSHHFWLDTEHVGDAIQSILVCGEMVIIVVLQQYAFHVAPYSGDVEAKLKLQKRYE